MIHDGIYEQIINNRIKEELLKLDVSNYDISIEQLDVEDARKVLSIYISTIIRQGLRYVREGFKSTEDQKALLAQIELCNDIIDEITLHTKETDFEDLKITEQGEVLRSLYRKMNSARSISPNAKTVRPQTSLSESTLFTGSRQEPSMLSELKKEIASCDRVDFLVSFIKWSAIRKIMPELKEFTSREGARLRILTTTYIQATDFKAIMELAKLPNTEVRVNYETSHMRMHAKAYLFYRETGFTTAYIGSSNLSNDALTDGLEWNVKVTEQDSFDIVKKFHVTFESYWNDASFEAFDPEQKECCDKLRQELGKNKINQKNPFRLQCSIHPYPYQQEMLDQLEAERKIYGRFKNLLVGATGCGKSVLAAFDYRRFCQEHPDAKLLFIAHRKEILEQCMQTFREVLNDFNFGGLYVDGKRPDQIKHLFMSIQSFNASGLIKHTGSDFYDFIIVDEFHHAAATSYQSLLRYYQPKILLGLTATPERMDGKDVLGYFDGRIAAEMRLAEAIDRKLLCPFQYFGVTDDVDYSKLKWRGTYDIAELENIYTADTKRAALTYNSVLKYVTDIDEVKGLGFCVSIKHAEYMAKYFNDHGIPSVSLSGKSPAELRDHAKDDLVTGKIRFIFVVDLYNEGVDIPQINTILFLRPTESATIFLQQLGRGLRLYKGKECLTVLDLIGQSHKKYNYETKFRAMIGKSRQSVQKQIEDGFANLPRGCYIELEKQAQDYVLRNLKEAVVNKNHLIEKVRTFEADTGLPLTLTNFLDYHQLRLQDIYQTNGERSFYRLKQWAGIVKEQRDADKNVWNKLNGLLHVNSVRLLDYWISYIETEKHVDDSMDHLMQNMLYYTFYKGTPGKNGFASVAEGIEAILRYDFVKEEILEILRNNRAHIGFVAKQNQYPYNCPLELHCSYNIRQIMAAYGYFNEDRAPEFREGVKYFDKLKTDIFLINLNKSEKEFSPSTMYDDYAINDRLFHWQSQSTTSEMSETGQRYIHQKRNGNMISLFVREYKKDGGFTAPYIFLGNADYVSHSGSKPISFTWKLKDAMPPELLPKANKSVAIG